MNQEIRVIGAKTFVLTDGCFVDTAFDPGKMQAEAIPFVGIRYLALMDEHPDWGRYLALGDRVIFVIEDQAYEITPGTPEREPARAPASDELSGVTEPGLSAGLWEQIGDWWRDFWASN